MTLEIRNKKTPQISIVIHTCNESQNILKSIGNIIHKNIYIQIMFLDDNYSKLMYGFFAFKKRIFEEKF